MTEFIDVERRFHELTDQEIDALENLATWSEHLPSLTIGWPELLKHHRTILLAEAGAGKTAEMSHQAKRLTDKGEFAFFITLEYLDREPIDDILSTDEMKRFEQWRATVDAPAWFFLDAVDELKLTRGKLDRALLRLSRALDGRLNRARIIVSCRPGDWRPRRDAEMVRNRLPVPPMGTRVSSEPSEEMFMEGLRHEYGRTTSAATDEGHQDAYRSALRTFMMVAMSDKQIERFARQRGARDVGGFLAAVRRHDAWIFARRPLDLVALVETWKRHGALGTRAEQHETNVAAKLRDDPDRPDNDVLSEAKARAGAECLAFALALTRTRSIRSPEQEGDVDGVDGVLNPDDVLPDWSPAERKALLRRGLFDPATYGRVRFHHRSTQEYLAAWRLRSLREQGMSTKAVCRLLFATCYGVDVVLPSMRPIAAWLALWNDIVGKFLMKREPEALLLYGDPESLEVAVRARIVREFVSMYGSGGGRGLNIPIQEVRRLADPELAPTIRECWQAGTSDDVRELLLEMIWQGAVKGCADLAREVALDESSTPYDRVVAIRALVKCNCHADVAQIATEVLDGPGDWPDRVVHGVAADLFPRFVTAEQLVALMERTEEPRQSVGGFEWVSQQIAEAVEPLSAAAVGLRNGLADLVRRGRLPGTGLYSLRSRFDYLAPALATLCERQLAALGERPGGALIRAIVVASRFGAIRDGDLSGSRWESIDRVKTRMSADPVLRRDAYWCEWAFVDEIRSTDNGRRRFQDVMESRVIDDLSHEDRHWLLGDLADRGQWARRAVALHALIFLWWRKGRHEAELNEIRERVGDDQELGRILAEETAPAEADKRMEEREGQRQARRSAGELVENRRLEGWRNWRSELMANPANAFSGTERNGTISNIWRFLNAVDGKRSRYDVWDKSALVDAFGSATADRAEEAFRGLWRSTRPATWSERVANERSRLPESWIVGLAGVSAEAATAGWSRRLPPEDLDTATRYAMIEMNGFAPFISDLVESHPEEVAKVVGGEARAAVAEGGAYDHLPVLHNLSHENEELQRLCVPYVLEALRQWPSVIDSEAGGRWSRHLEQVVRILEAADERAVRETIAEECGKRYRDDTGGPLAVVWLKGLFRFDAAEGARQLVAEAERGRACSDPEIGNRVIEALAVLFGEDDPVVLRVVDPAEHADLLGRLVRLAYTSVNPDEDRVHEGVYTPNTRDNTERARSKLFQWMCDTPGPEAWSALVDIAEEDEFRSLRDRVRLLARERAAMDAEFPAFDSRAVVALGKRHEVPPNDGNGLFAVMMDRLGDLAHDLAHDDFSDRRSVQSISDEREMQRSLSRRLKEQARAAYRVMREEEVADGKRTDIRLATVGSLDHRVVMEVKIADKWRVTDLAEAVRKQLVDKYLRHESCTGGCMLLTYHGEKHWWVHPDGKKRLSFGDVVGLLEGKGRALETERQNRIRVAVFGLDLTDPQPASG